MSDIKDVAIVAVIAGAGYFAVNTAIRSLNVVLWLNDKSSVEQQRLLPSRFTMLGEAAFSTTLGLVGVGALIFAAEKMGLTRTIEF